MINLRAESFLAKQICRWENGIDITSSRSSSEKELVKVWVFLKITVKMLWKYTSVRIQFY